MCVIFLRGLQGSAAQLLCVLFVLGGPLAACAQFVPPDTLSAVSHSGQFIVQGVRSTGWVRPPLRLENDPGFIRLDPSLLPVSCERIKQLLWRELGATARWRGSIHVALYPASSGDDTITITSERFRDGWQYQVTLPDLVERTRYVRALAQVLLLELANREAGQHSAEIPNWLSEGLAQQLLASSEKEIILTPPKGAGSRFSPPVTRVKDEKGNPLEQAHRVLCANPPLTFDQLSWPTDEQLAGAAGDIYRSSAQLFVAELLRLNDGPACLRAMLAELPGRYNWQFAFLDAFQPKFQRPLDVEKWWALQLVHFTGRELAQTWPAEEGWVKLDEALHASVQVRVGTNQLPMRAQVTLQTIIREWDQNRQTAALQTTLRELELLRLRMTPELVSLVDEYRQALTGYLQNRDKSGFPLLFRKQSVQRRALDETLLALDALDARRKALEPAQRPTVAVQAPAQP